MRFHILLNGEVGIWDLFDIVCVHNAANNILPARTGEVSYVYLVKKLHGIPASKSIATLVIARVFDFIMIGLIFFISVSFLSDVPEIILQVIWMTLISILLIMFVVVLAILCGEKVINVFKKYLSAVGITKFKLINFLFIQLHNIVKSFNENQTPKKTIYPFLLSAVVWISSFSMGYLLITNMGMQLHVWAILVGFTFCVLISILPVHGVGQFGTAEGAWTVIFISLGVGKEVAISTGFAYHILIIAFTIPIGIYGLIALNHR